MKKISKILFFVALSPLSATSVPTGEYNYARDNKYTIVYLYKRADQKNLLTIFSDVARNKRYAHSGLRFRALYVGGARDVTAQQMYAVTDNNTILILREGRLYENARMTGAFSRDQLIDFIEGWIGDYLDALLSAKKESKRAATAVAYASYPPYWGYPYYGPYYGWGYPYGYGYGAGYGFGIWF